MLGDGLTVLPPVCNYVITHFQAIIGRLWSAEFPPIPTPFLSHSMESGPIQGLSPIDSNTSSASPDNQSKTVLHWALFKFPSLFNRRDLFVEQTLSYWNGWISATQLLLNKMIIKKILIISKLGLHKISKKPSSVWLLMQSTVRSGWTKIAKVGTLAVELLKTPNFSPGYLFEVNCSWTTKIDHMI